MRVFQHNTFTLTIHSLCWAKIRSNYFKPYYYSVTMFNLHYSQLTLLINFTSELSYNILHWDIAKFVIKYCNLVSKYINLDNSKWLELEKYLIFQNAQKKQRKNIYDIESIFLSVRSNTSEREFHAEYWCNLFPLFSNLLVFLQCYIFLSFKYLWCYFPREVDTHHAKEK